MFSTLRNSVCLAIALVTCGDAFADQKPADAAATTKILVFNASPMVNTPDGFADSASAMLKSREIAERAARSKKLADIDGILADKGIEVIFAGLQVVRDKSASEVVFDVTMNGVKPEAGAIILEAVIEAYRDYLAEIHRNAHDRIIQDMRLASTEVAQKIRKADDQYVEAISSKEATESRQEQTTTTKGLDEIAAKLVTLNAERKVIGSQVDSIKILAGRDEAKDYLGNLVADWAKNEKVPQDNATLDTYQTVLKAKLDKVEASRNNAAKAYQELLEKARQQNGLEHKLQQLNAERSRMRALFDVVMNRVEVMLAQKDRGGIQVAYISKPASVKK